MNGLQLTLDWNDILLRLGGAIVAGILIGLNRGERGKPAGLRTTLLVCLAAALAMILGNLLITTHGKTSDSFVQLDMMRLPLGILSGIGFIGAGTILKKGDLIVGVTTAATIWFVSVIGLCFGAGEFALGGAGTILGLVVLSALTWVEHLLMQEHHGILEVVTEGTNGGLISEDEIRRIVQGLGHRISSCGTDSERIDDQVHRRTFSLELKWQARRYESPTPMFIKDLEARPGVTRVVWRGTTVSG